MWIKTRAKFFDGGKNKFVAYNDYKNINRKNIFLVCTYKNLV